MVYASSILAVIPGNKLSFSRSFTMDSRPAPKHLSHHLSRVTRARHESSIKAFYKYFQIPGIGQLAGGLPNNYYFPFDTLEAKVARPDRWQPTPNHPVDPPPDHEALAALSLNDRVRSENSPLNQPQDAIVVPHTSEQPNPIKKIDLSTALQYGQAQGYPPLYYFIREFTQKGLHPNCPYKDGPEVVLTCGNTDGFGKVLTALSNEWSEEKHWIRDREGLLVESFAYMNAVQAAVPRGLHITPVAIDDEGMIAEGPGGLRGVLENWDYKRGKRPHLMYTVTMGQNPTSGVLSLQRRREIYALCCKYDIIIVEDDPYWYLQFPTSTAVNTTSSSHAENFSFNPDQPMFANAEPVPQGWKKSGYPFLDSLVPSSVSIDTEGRVIRLDTFSKTVAPGCRLGWITGQPALIERILRVTETSTQQPSGFVQAMLAELILGPDHEGLGQKVQKPGKGPLRDGEGWKFGGWVRWLEGLRGNYERRMNSMCRILDSGKYLVKSGRRPSLLGEEDAENEDADEWSVIEKTQLYSFDWPVGGMFLWLKVHFETHPLYSAYKKETGGLTRFSRALWIFWTTKPYRVLGAPGTMFSPTEEIAEKEGWKFFRLCFAAINEDQLGPVSQRLSDGVQAFWRIKDKKKIEELLDEAEANIAAKDGLCNLGASAYGC
ncbi:Aromatic amino acid aminotransferase C56E4.03 [Pseudocercospora fuligena]|uniref:Aromatic amino acid aminotransferase C56E4.03 n=1 Tax=Pseudocercospora fuligena TaxID=685502 RepID=A0A8H6R9Q2_9PEZI|nr:Aromatic amino acid aminotransferase C56E4.03 [Pseudocercospora fuligena]